MILAQALEDDCKSRRACSPETPSLLRLELLLGDQGAEERPSGSFTPFLMPGRPEIRTLLAHPAHVAFGAPGSCGQAPAGA